MPMSTQELDRIRRAMAYDRPTFKASVMEKLDGALGHYYMSETARLNGQTKWVEHWRNEVNRLLFAELEVVVSKPIKGRWDRRKAIAEVLAELEAEDAQHRRAAENVVKRYYGLRKVTSLPALAHEAFYQMVRDAVDEGLDADRDR